MLWREIQHNYFVYLGSRRTGARWVSALVTKLWQVAWDQWDDRNGALHKTPLAIELRGALTLDRAIRIEW